MSERIDPGMGVVFKGDLSELSFRQPVSFHVDLCDPSEQLGEHEFTVARCFRVIIASRRQHIGSFNGRHCLLLFGAHDQNDVV